jgi:hypothetical protein
MKVFKFYSGHLFLLSRKDYNDIFQIILLLISIIEY